MQVSKVTKARRDCPNQLIACEVQHGDITQFPEVGTNGTCKIIVCQVQMLELCQSIRKIRQRTREAVDGHAKEAYLLDGEIHGK